MAERLLVTFAVSPEQALAAWALSRSLVFIGDLTPRALVGTVGEGSLNIEFQELHGHHFPGFEEAERFFPEYDRLFVHPSALAFKRLGGMFDRFQPSKAVIQAGASIRSTALLYLGAHQAPDSPEEADESAMNPLGDPLEGLHLKVLENRFLYSSGGRAVTPALLDGRAKPRTAMERHRGAFHWVDRYEKQHSFGYMPQRERWQRSIERRILKSRGRG